jgi:hypothetical protein
MLLNGRVSKSKGGPPMKLTVKRWNLKIEGKVKFVAEKRDRLN